MRFARPFWIAAVCAFGLLMGTSAVQAQNTKLLPNDTELVFTINLAQILKSEVVTKNELILGIAKGKIEEQLDEKGIAKFLKKADFDLFRDLHTITIAVPGGNRNPEDSFILIEGKFDAEKIEAMAKEVDKETGGVKVIKIGNVNAFEVSPKEDKKMYVGILDAKTVIATASKADFAEAVSRLNGRKTAAFKSEVIKSLLETVNSKQSISLVATSNLMAKLAENAPQGAGGDKAKQFMEILKQTDGFSTAVTIQKDIDFLFGINTKNADTASKYALQGGLLIAGAKAMLAAEAKKNEKLGPVVDILNTLKLTTQGANLVVRGQITFDTLAEVLKGLPLPKD